LDEQSILRVKLGAAEMAETFVFLLKQQIT
jgi:hypothetical protein